MDSKPNISATYPEPNEERMEMPAELQRSIDAEADAEAEARAAKKKARRSRPKVAQVADVPAAVENTASVNAEQPAKNAVAVGDLEESGRRVPEEQEKLPVHPYAAMFPLMPNVELKPLADDVLKNGLKEPIKTWHGRVIDGRNRLAACILAGVKPVLEALDDLTEAQVLHFIMSRNVLRRHLTDAGRQVIAARLVTMERGHAGAQRDSDTAKCGISIAEAAAMLHVSPESVERARKLLKVAPDLADQVVAGEMKNGRKLTISGALEIAEKRTEKESVPIEVAAGVGEVDHPAEAGTGEADNGHADSAPARSADEQVSEGQRIAGVVRAFKDAVHEAEDSAKAIQHAQLRKMLLMIAKSVGGVIQEVEAVAQQAGYIKASYRPGEKEA